MTTFAKVFIKCPHCGIELYDYDLMSYTVYRSTIFSDAKMVSEPYTGNDRDIALCKVCNKLFWRADAMALPETDELLSKDLEKAGDIMDLSMTKTEDFPENLIALYDELIRNGFAGTIERKIYLRIRLWWAINDLIRDYSSLAKQLSGLRSFGDLSRFVRNRISRKKSFWRQRKLFEENLRDLIKIFIVITEEDTLMLAEMHRELGNSSEALKILNGMEDKSWKAYKMIKSANRLYRRKVMLISA